MRRGRMIRRDGKRGRLLLLIGGVLYCGRQVGGGQGPDFNVSDCMIEVLEGRGGLTDFPT